MISLDLPLDFRAVSLSSPRPFARAAPTAARMPRRMRSRAQIFVLLRKGELPAKLSSKPPPPKLADGPRRRSSLRLAALVPVDVEPFRVRMIEDVHKQQLEKAVRGEMRLQASVRRQVRARHPGVARGGLLPTGVPAKQASPSSFARGTPRVCVSACPPQRAARPVRTRTLMPVACFPACTPECSRTRCGHPHAVGTDAPRVWQQGIEPRGRAQAL